MTNQRNEDREPSGEGAGPARRPRGSLGAWLRAQREARGVSLREIADDSKISLRYLEALEDDRFGVLPAPVFTRGFLREYARIVGLDGDEVVNLYLQVAPPREAESGELLVPPAAAAPRRTGPGRATGPMLGIALLLVAGLVALLVWWLRREAPVPGPAANPPAVAAPAAVAEAARQPEAPAAQIDPRATPDPAPTPDQGLRGVAPGAGATAEPPPAAVPAALAVVGEPEGDFAAAEPLRVVLEFSQDCWVEFTVDGGRRTSELRAAGEVVTLVARDHVLLTLGNLAGVAISIDGRPWSPPAGEGARVTRDLRIDRSTAAGAP